MTLSRRAFMQGTAALAATTALNVEPAQAFGHSQVQPYIQRIEAAMGNATVEKVGVRLGGLRADKAEIDALYSVCSQYGDEDTPEHRNLARLLRNKVQDFYRNYGRQLGLGTTDVRIALNFEPAR